MNICGINKTTLLDFPGLVACTLFTGGCNFRCPFCHNKDLVLGIAESKVLEEEIFAFLQKRKGILQGVCITGGEPTLQKDLVTFIERVKELGYKVKLDTNGYCPEVLKELLDKKLLDYVAVDIKATKEKYAQTVGLENLQLSRIEESVALLKQWNGAYEFRTTVVKGLHEREDFAQIGEWIRGCKNYYIQSYRENENVLCPGFEAFPREELEGIVELVKGKGIETYLRGVE